MSAIEEPNEFGSAVKAWMTKPEDAETWLNIGYGYWSNRFHSTGIKWADLTVVEVLRVGAESAPVKAARDEYSDAMNLELRRSIAANVLEAMDVDQYLIDAVRNASPEPEEPGIPVEKVRAQQADFLKRADWARSHGTLEAASIWVSAADLLQYLLPEEPTS